ncbi:LysR family transcriptional regulator [Bradyrhizobium japonicum]|uniref:LysR family transcriptional regulator n=1 Tax=Bradyrhizobium japonicum TaxID=375 RepID=UPI00040E81C3|nr:LysR family transcriptional regulator [Bradyrhizobium japonicum]MCS3896244.1 DNA-binding transcriptional LysR family regulator [Bradyrhizobium japonicum USDA 38]MCS3948758.1 DNA-binding transcriptional LysR family regulator [Bradyrhizobium japonicum]MCW2218510.1 DNA-binding transcriptional LysR family regulator [Bradyrhizobium japonicum]MCW2343124.1 DNA-binding transcriptional LysR family regulator [Bradyrhizobium japonicum]UQD68813.1 LysR family transcriptional regulator [Bradyrhizobium ja
MKPANLRIDVITTFIAIVEAGSMREASRRLGVSKSVVSQRLSALEAALNVRLLSRSTRQQALTDSGKYFFERCQKIAEDFQLAAEEVSDRQDEFSGTIRIAAPMSFAVLHLTDVFSTFLQTHPLIDLQIEFDDRMHDLVGDSFDMAVRIGRLKNSALIARRFGLSNRVVVCSPRYIAENGKPHSIESLENHYAVSYANLTPQSEWIFRRGDEIKSVTPKSRMRVNSGDIQLAAVKDGVAIAALPLFIVHKAIEAREVQIVDLDWQLVPDDLCIVYPQNRFLARKVRALSAAIIAHIGSPPRWESRLSAEQQEKLKS